jgi:hypothetical protein
MKTVPAWVRGAFLVAVGLLIVAPGASAAGGKGSGGKGGGHSSAPRATFRAQAAPRSAAPHVSAQRQTATGQSAARAARSAQSRQSANAARSAQARVAANATRSTQARQTAKATGSVASGVVGSNSTYRAGMGRSNAYRYRPRTSAYRGYSYGNRYATGNRNIQSLVTRLRATHRSLAQINHDYQGHRVRAMRAVGTAIRQLTNRSSSTVAFNNNLNGLGANNLNGLGANNLNGLRARNGAALGGGVAGGQMLPQAQSDARMKRALSTLRGVHTQLTRQGYTANHARARSSVQNAMRELNIGLTVR